MPSVINLIYVRGLVTSVKRILKPTSLPNGEPSSSATRAATLRAAIRRGCVWPMSPSNPRPKSRQIFGNCVLLPLPVSPHTTITWCRSMAVAISSRRAEMGNSSGNVTRGRPFSRANCNARERARSSWNRCRLCSDGLPACWACSMARSWRRSRKRSACKASSIWEWDKGTASSQGLGLVGSQGSVVSGQCEFQCR